MHPDCLTEADIRQTEPLKLLRLVGGYYLCPKDAHGRRLGKLVGYSAVYEAPNGTKKQYVGDVYANFALVEQHPIILQTWASMMADELAMVRPTLILGMPMGGIFSAFAWAAALPGVRCAFAEKKVTALATAEKREQSEPVLGRHSVRRGDRVLIAEDVCNNFSTTNKAIKLVLGAGGEVAGIVCWLNRSRHSSIATLGAPGSMIPVISLVHKELPEYEQEDLRVAGDIVAGNVALKPKEKEVWAELQASMQTALS
ncbi:MAG: hypothetical protein KW788_01845 [Candidatus Doudnabacteria bacterium]|nr:hypothetical protein [Candidatus Doudnabacteria bacterium]